MTKDAFSKAGELFEKLKEWTEHVRDLRNKINTHIKENIVSEEEKNIILNCVDDLWKKRVGKYENDLADIPSDYKKEQK